MMALMQSGTVDIPQMIAMMQMMGKGEQSAANPSSASSGEFRVTPKPDPDFWSATGSDMATCSTHGRKRTVRNLIPDGNGGMTCSPSSQCNVGGGPGVTQVGGKMPGDWMCAVCGDHQFSRNVVCRKCGAAKSEDQEIAASGPPAWAVAAVAAQQAAKAAAAAGKG